MTSYTPWTWSESHQRHYSYLLAADGSTILDTLWSGPQPGGLSNNSSTPRSSTQVSSLTTQTPSLNPRSAPLNYTTTASSSARQAETSAGVDEDNVVDEDDDEPEEAGSNVQTERVDSPIASPQRPTQNQDVRAPQTVNLVQSWPQIPTYTNLNAGSSRLPVTNQSTQPYQAIPATTTTRVSSNPRSTIGSLPADVQADIGYLDRRFIQTGPDRNNAETLDSRYRRVAKDHHMYFFVPGRVFKMLWIEPAGQANPGRTRNSTHFSTVRFGEQAYSEIRRFVVVRNKGTFSQCIPVQTYKGRGATKPGIVMQDHGVIHTTPEAPNLLPGEFLTKYSIRVQPTAHEILEPQSRVNYGKAYAVEHNVKVLDVGMVIDNHRYLIESYFDSAMRGR
jgi:hypothetical protein